MDNVYTKPSRIVSAEENLWYPEDLFQDTVIKSLYKIIELLSKCQK